MPAQARTRRSTHAARAGVTLAALTAAVAVAMSVRAGPAEAQEGAAEAPPPIIAVPEPPDLPTQVKSGETLEPEVTIKRDEKRTITEYRLNGRLTAVKVETEGFPTYYLVDTDGDGRPETRRDRFTEDDLVIPHWVLFRW